MLYLRRRDSCITNPNRDDVPRNVGKAFGALCGIVGALSLVINKCVTRLTRIEVTTIARSNTWEILSLASRENLLPRNCRMNHNSRHRENTFKSA